MAIVALRWLLVVVLLLTFQRQTLARDWPTLCEHLPYLFVMGTLGLAAFNGLFYVAAHHTSALNMGIIQGMMPVFVLLGALAAYRTPISTRQWVGTSLTLVGVVVVAAAGDLSRLLELRLNNGDVFVALATLLYAGYTLGLRRRPESSAIGLFTVLAVAAFIASIPMVAMEAWAGDFQAPTTRGWAIVALVALFPSFLAQIMFMRGVELIGPGRAGVFINLVPVFGAIIAVAYLGENFHAYHALSLAMVLVGIWLAER